MNGDKTFLGTGWGFPPSFDPSTRHAVLASHEEDVAQSLWILLSTTPGERVMQPTFGCGLKRLVFEPINENILTELRDLIQRAVLFFEPRITLESVDFDLDQLEPRVVLKSVGSEHDRVMGGELRVRLVYRIRSTNSRANLVYPLYRFEGRHPVAPSAPVPGE